MSNLSQYFKDTFAELKQVHWPTQKQAMLYTVLVIVISVIVALFLGAFDFVFNAGIEQVISRL